MNDEQPPSSTGPSWLERLAHVLSGEPRDRDQLTTVLRDATERGLMDADALAMMEGAMQVSDMSVVDVMLPRSQVIMVEQNGDRETLLHAVVDSAHSRFPVFGESRDEVVGILLAKDLLAALVQSEGRGIDVHALMRPAIFVPESKRLNVLLKEFRASRNHMAIVVDEYGAVSGIVTIEDVIEEIVGEIDDEHDVDDEAALIVADGSDGYDVEASVLLEQFNEKFATELAHEEVETLGGYLVQDFGHVPDEGESTVLEGLQFVVTASQGGRILQLKVRPAPADADSGGTGDDELSSSA